MKTALITGASRGIGLATAKKFLQEGWQVIGTHMKTEIPITNNNLVAIQYDQGDTNSIVQAVKDIMSRTSHLDVIVNNAALLIESNDMVADAEKIRTTLEVNVVGLVDLTERLLPLLTKGSHVINIGSGYGAFSASIDGPWAAGYRMSKAAVHMYTRQLAFRLKPQGIIVSAVSPGWINTDMGRSLATETEGPIISPEHVAENVFSLAEITKETGCLWQDNKKREW
ncbi:SDR family oxidoreductase [Candidatus Uhrbacteria bacterium]|nr:SDR family oxidoreductase [Candidatus Uhrbacteria bacterium]